MSPGSNPLAGAYAIGEAPVSGRLAVERESLLNHIHRENVHLHGVGIICGLRVVPGLRAGRPWWICVCPGYALDPCGNEIYLPCLACVDVSDYVWLRPTNDGVEAAVAFVGIKYAEELVRPVPAKPATCGCPDPVYRASRIRDAYRIDILWVPPSPDQPIPDLCSQSMPPCPPPPTSPYVYLATITLPPSEADPITADLISNLYSVRGMVCRDVLPRVFSTNIGAA